MHIPVSDLEERFLDSGRHDLAIAVQDHHYPGYPYNISHFLLGRGMGDFLSPSGEVIPVSGIYYLPRLEFDINQVRFAKVPSFVAASLERSQGLNGRGGNKAARSDLVPDNSVGKVQGLNGLSVAQRNAGEDPSTN